jgi:hypothetical protein
MAIAFKPRKRIRKSLSAAGQACLTSGMPVCRRAGLSAARQAHLTSGKPVCHRAGLSDIR